MEKQGTGNRERATGNVLRRGADIAERLLALASAIVGLARRMPRDVAGRHVASQVVRSATSAGANYEEARAAESRSDFVHKVRLAAKEMRETIFWLRLIRSCAMVSSTAATNLDAIVGEATELVAILMASARTARTNGS
jgi:four helix bundle protein